MGIRGQCPACQAKFKVGSKYAGKKLPCPKCHAIIDIPQESLPEPQAPPINRPAPTPPALEEEQSDNQAAASEAPSPLAGLSINVSARPAAVTRAGLPRAAMPRTATDRKKRQALTLVLSGAAAVVVLAAGLAAVLWWPSAETKSQQVARAPAATSQALPSPPIARSNSTEPPLASKREIPAVAAAADSAESPVAPAIPHASILGFEGWLQNLHEAKRRAAEDSKDIVIVFGCSDTQPATQQLAQALKLQASEEALASLVRVVIDYPRTRGGFDRVEDGAQNRQLWLDYGLERLPALALADSQGRPYWLVRRFEGGYDKLATQLGQWQLRKAERDKLLADAKGGSEEEQLASAQKAIDWLHEHDLWMCYGKEIDAWMKLAAEADPENKKGMLEAFFEPHWYLRVSSVPSSDSDTAGQVVAELDPWIKRRFQDPDRGAKLHLMAARLLQSARRFDDGVKQMEHAIGYQPLDAKLVDALRDARQIVEHREIVGTGTGFLISSAGYLLTNHHVVEGEGPIVVRVPGLKEMAAVELVAHDESQDIALLKMRSPDAQNFTPLALSDSAARRGAAVAGFGFPLGDTLGKGLKLSAGTVSAVPDETNPRYLLNLTVNPGNSGGPLCDRRGNVVGMISEKTSSEGLADSYGLAIPAADLIKFADQHLPLTARRPSPNALGEELDWDKVDERVSSGVLMVVKKRP